MQDTRHPWGGQRDSQGDVEVVGSPHRRRKPPAVHQLHGGLGGHRRRRHRHPVVEDVASQVTDVEGQVGRVCLCHIGRVELELARRLRPSKRSRGNHREGQGGIIGHAHRCEVSPRTEPHEGEVCRSWDGGQERRSELRVLEFTQVPGGLGGELLGVVPDRLPCIGLDEGRVELHDAIGHSDHGVWCCSWEAVRVLHIHVVHDFDLGNGGRGVGHETHTHQGILVGNQDVPWQVGPHREPGGAGHQDVLTISGQNPNVLDGVSPQGLPAIGLPVPCEPGRVGVVPRPPEAGGRHDVCGHADGVSTEGGHPSTESCESGRGQGNQASVSILTGEVVGGPPNGVWARLDLRPSVPSGHGDEACLVEAPTPCVSNHEGRGSIGLESDPVDDREAPFRDGHRSCGVLCRLGPGHVLEEGDVGGACGPDEVLLARLLWVLEDGSTVLIGRCLGKGDSEGV